MSGTFLTTAVARRVTGASALLEPVVRAAGLALLAALPATGAFLPQPALAHSAPRSTPARAHLQAARHSGSGTVSLLHRRVVHVSIKNLAFAPARIEVSRGTQVVWTNGDSFRHTVTSDSAVWDSGPVEPSASFRRVFGKAGAFAYHCTIHPFMHGSITVK